MLWPWRSRCSPDRLFLSSRVGCRPRNEPVSPKSDGTSFKILCSGVYSVSNLLQGLGYFFPSLYLPSYASSLRLGDKSGALLLALMSACQVCGQFVFGLLSDYRVPLNILACLSTTVAAVACFTMWRLAESLTFLIFFAIVYGFFGAGFTAIWARMSTAITDDVTAGPIVFTLLNLGKGIGNVLAGPIGGLLVSKLNSAGTPSSSSYRWVIVFTGTCMFASTCIICLRYTKCLAISLARENGGGGKQHAVRPANLSAKGVVMLLVLPGLVVDRGRGCRCPEQVARQPLHPSWLHLAPVASYVLLISNMSDTHSTDWFSHFSRILLPVRHTFSPGTHVHVAHALSLCSSSWLRRPHSEVTAPCRCSRSSARDT